MKRTGFTAKERAYLLSLPAVEAVTPERIFYSDDFRRECMRRYYHGESPARIFREAGLYSSLIGYKRIERCIARWRDSDIAEKIQDDDGGDSHGNAGKPIPSVYVDPATVGPGHPATEPFSTVGKRQRRSTDASGDVSPSHSARRTQPDVSGMILIRYESRLRALERQVSELQQRVEELQEHPAE